MQRKNQYDPKTVVSFAAEDNTTLRDANQLFLTTSKFSLVIVVIVNAIERTDDPPAFARARRVPP